MIPVGSLHSYMRSEECRNAVGTTSKPIYHHTLNWGLAIAYMISKGETEKTNGNDFAQLTEEYKGKHWFFTLSVSFLPHL